MSSKYPGGIISKTAPTPSGPFENSTAPGIWTLEQQAAYAKQGNWPTAGNVDPSAFIENLFSTYLYTGNATTGQSINNGIDLATKGGLLWCKNRTTGSTPHYLFDTARDFSYSNAAVLNTASTAAQEDKGTDYAKPETNGFSFGSGAGSTSPNKSGDAFASWTFRKQPKFFDVITWTGNGAATQTISHNLGSAPGCIIAKVTSTTGNWFVYHRGTSGTPLQDYLRLNLTNAANASGSDLWGATSTTITVDSGLNLTTNGATYVAYLFAHDAGGFGLTGTDNVISCGSFTTDGSANATVNLGYEPQWVMIKSSSNTGNWFVIDNMRNFSRTVTASLSPNLSNAELAGFGDATYSFFPTATGFQSVQDLAASQTYIYIAIRRGPMKVPTSGTSVYNGIARTGNGTATTVSNSGFTPDMVMSAPRTAGSSYGLAFPFDRLRGPLKMLETRTSQAEQTGTGTLTGFDTMNGYIVGSDASGYGAINASAVTYINWNFRRAPSFFDEVCYLGNNVSGRTITHNLAAVPELMIVKSRTSSTRDWMVYDATNGATKAMNLNNDSVTSSSSVWASTAPTSTVFTVSDSASVNDPAQNYVAYLFATCAGVSKVGSYTGTGTTQTINCGFTAGSRFVLIKRTDSTGDWYVWDSARGIVAGNDPYLLLNSTAAEVTNTDYVDTYSAGFEISSTAPAAINANGGTFIFLAIA